MSSIDRAHATSPSPHLALSRSDPFGRVAGAVDRIVARDATFVVATFVLGRALTALAFFVLAPHLHAPPHGISPVANAHIFTHWDGDWFRIVALYGYHYVRDGGAHDVAFFPLYPLLVEPFVRLGASFAVVGPIVSNVAFLGALFVVFDFARARAGVVVARFAVATLALAPTALFGSIAYSEGLFLLLSSLALRDADRGMPLRAALWAAFASATRVVGVALAFGFFVEAVRRRTDARAWLATAIAPLGALAYMAYLGARFGDPLAFVHTESGWRKLGPAGSGAWSQLLWLRFVSHHHWVYIAAFALVAAAYVRLRHRFGEVGSWIAAVVTVVAWAKFWGIEDNAKLLFVGVAGYALVRYAKGFAPLDLGYAFATFVIIFAAGPPLSSERFAWALVPGTIALAYLWRRFPRIGYATIAVGAIELLWWSLLYAQVRFTA